VPTQAVVPNQEGEPEEEEQEQAPQEQEQAPRGPPRETDPPEVMVAAVFEAGVPATYEEYTKKLKELYDKKTNPFTTLQSAVKYLREEKGVQITLSRNPTKNSYFNAYKNAVMKKQGGPVRRGRGALGLGVGYKFGKHEIHKRGLKKKF
jgi:hypothetical protein